MLYREILVWQRVGSRSVACYRCLQRLSDGLFCVQSKDLFHLPASEKQRQDLASQFVELLVEEDPVSRSGGFASLEDAIRAHELYFQSADEHKN